MDEDMNGIGTENSAVNDTNLRVVKRSELRKKPKRRLPVRLIIILLVIIAALTALVIFAFRGRDIDMSESNVLMNVSYELSSKADFYTYNGNVFYSTKDSMRCLDGKGREKWVDSYTMLSPVMIGDKNVAAVAEKNGTNVRVYNEDGLLYNVTFTEPVITFAVNGGGYMGAIVKKGQDYELALYNDKGDKVYGGNYVARQGIPMAIDISDDSRMFAVAFMDVSNIKLKSNVLFYYINKDDTKGVESSNGMFSSVVSEDCMPFMLKFTPDGRCIALMDDRAVFIDPAAADETKKRLEIPVGNHIAYACVNGDGTVAVAFGEPLLNAAEQLEKNTVVWYDSKGARVNEFRADKDITGLYAGSDITVVAMDRSFAAYKTKGGSVWQYTALQDTLKVLPYSGSDKMLAVTSLNAFVAKVGKGNNLIEAQRDEAGNFVADTEATTLEVQSAAQEETTAAAQSEQTTEAVQGESEQTTSEEQTTTAAEQTTAAAEETTNG